MSSWIRGFTQYRQQSMEKLYFLGLFIFVVLVKIRTPRLIIIDWLVFIFNRFRFRFRFRIHYYNMTSIKRHTRWYSTTLCLAQVQYTTNLQVSWFLQIALIHEFLNSRFHTIQATINGEIVFPWIIYFRRVSEN
jgi:hypothetical protein